MRCTSQSVNTVVKPLISARATPTAVLEGLQDHQFAHLIYHGILEQGNHQTHHSGSREQAAFVARHHAVSTSYAGFAFLAASHTAEPTNGSPVDEALHPTAAMQSRRFRSDIGTTWAVADADGRDLARTFHESVF